MKLTTTHSNGHTWHFIQTGGLVQLQISSIEDVLELDRLDPKLWIALACPVKGLEFSEETLSAIDTDKDGRVRVPEILEAVAYIRKYFKKPEAILSPGDSLPLDALGDEPFACGYSPAASARAVLDILGRQDATEITLADVDGNDRLFSPSVINGDGVLPAEAARDEAAAAVVRDIIACTGGSDDISGAKGATRGQFEAFFADLRAVQAWREGARQNAPEIYFLGPGTDAAAAAYMKVRGKVDDFYLRCSLGTYNGDVADSLRKKEEEALGADLLDPAEMARLPLARANAERVLPLGGAVNPAWQADVADFAARAVAPILGAGKKAISEAEWRQVEAAFAPYMAWYGARPASCAGSLSFERIDEILAGGTEKRIASYLDEEDRNPPIALAAVDLRRMLLYRRDFVELLRNFASFETFYSKDGGLAIFQCGTLYIDGRSCDLCFRVADAAKHAAMSPMSQCYLLYCECRRPQTGEKMEIAAVMSAGSRDNLIVGRNGLFYDRQGRDWDATVTKIVENPISIREAFFSPYKKLLRMIQERIAKTAADAEGSVDAKMAAAVDKPADAAGAAEAGAAAKKIDVGTIAALSVAFTGIATVAGGLLQAFFGLGWWIPVGIAGIILIISLPSMFIAWLKLRQRNIAPILDASGWAVNGNVRINITMGGLFTQLARRPPNSRLDALDPFREKRFPLWRAILCAVLLALLAGAVAVVARHGWSIPDAWQAVQGFFAGLFTRRAAVPVPPAS